MRNAFQSRIRALNTPLLLEQNSDIDELVSIWKSVVESIHKGDSRRMPGFSRGGIVTYWEGMSWKTIGAFEAANKCKIKGDNSLWFPGPP